jgi:hypothetical protein
VLLSAVGAVIDLVALSCPTGTVVTGRYGRGRLAVPGRTVEIPMGQCRFRDYRSDSFE